MNVIDDYTKINARNGEYTIIFWHKPIKKEESKHDTYNPNNNLQYYFDYKVVIDEKITSKKKIM